MPIRVSINSSKILFVSELPWNQMKKDEVIKFEKD